MTTLVLNRSLLHVHRVEAVEAHAPGMQPTTPDNRRTGHPFGATPSYLDDWQLEEEIEEEIQIGDNPPVYAKGSSLEIELRNIMGKK